MTVTIVSTDTTGDRILPRLARLLAAGTGWKLSRTPNEWADLNLFLVYIDYAETFRKFAATPIAAWFTHYENGHELKEDWWHYAAQNLNLRLTSAPMYLERLVDYGPTALVRPPIPDRERYSIKPLPRNPVPKVGVSGFIPPRRHGDRYRQHSRKGEHLVLALARSDLARHITLVASGQGWPVRRQNMRRVDELPQFYQELDVFLCTSLVEGIPLPPLEALACGVPVVIPRGVGMLDELPSVVGIYRYKRGDYDDMLLALEQATAEAGHPGVIDRQALADAVAEYTPANWCADIQRAVEGLLA